MSAKAPRRRTTRERQRARAEAVERAIERAEKPAPTADENSVQNTVQNTVTTAATMPGRNGGRLRRGNPGNAGRPAAELRQRCVGSAGARLHVLEEIADDKDAPRRERMHAIGLLLRYALDGDPELRVSSLRERLRRHVELLYGRVLPIMERREFDQLMDEFEAIWDGGR
jgi:hypothetical protein